MGVIHKQTMMTMMMTMMITMTMIIAIMMSLTAATDKPKHNAMISLKREVSAKQSDIQLLTR